jgi:glucans biosynthesis protein
VLVENGTGEWLWRPVMNPTSLQMHSFSTQSMRGFGLVQRDRNFDHYQDLEARSDRRPSVWIAPKQDWGRGRVELVEIPTDDDTNDNLVAYWVPDALPPNNGPLAYSYDMSWFDDDRARPPGARAAATRRDENGPEGTTRFLVDFEGGRLPKLDPETVVRGVLTVDGREDSPAILDQQAVRNPVTGGWRLVFLIRNPEDAPRDLRAFLQLGEDSLSETWTTVLEP